MIDQTAIEAPAWRTHALEALAGERFDVLIVGGGIVGAGALLDATSRGLRAALVEQRDIASGTSGRSSRLIHGGLRYLEQLHFGLVYEALEERARLLRLAPHLVTLEPFGVLSLKGRAGTVAAYRVVSLDRPTGPSATPFVGRDDEIRRIMAVYDAAVTERRARLAAVLGSPGLGKSRLVAEATRDCRPATIARRPRVRWRRSREWWRRAGSSASQATWSPTRAHSSPSVCPTDG